MNWVKFQVLKAASMKITVFWDVAPSYWLHHQGYDGAASTSETSVNVYQSTRCNIPDDSHLQQWNDSVEFK
jgi:hypothetical protein